MKRVVVHIDSLVLRGFRHEDRHVISAGLQNKLARLFADPTAVQQLMALGDVPRLKVGDIQIGAGSKPQHIAVEVAHGIGREVVK